MGLHKESLSRGRESVDFQMVQERRLTFWSVYAFEITTCYGFGRPISINDCDISIPYPEDQPFFLSVVMLARIYARASRTLYGMRQGSLLALWKAARGFKTEMDEWRSSLPAELAVGPDHVPAPGAPAADLAVLRTFLGTMYYHGVILTFRPFVIFHAQWLRGNHRLPDAASVHVSARQLRARAPWILEACGYCVGAARELLVCIAQDVERFDIVRRMRYGGFYIEGAAFLLIFNILRDRADLAIDTRCVRLGLRAVDMIGDSVVSRICGEAIRHMLRLVESDEEAAAAAARSASGSSGGTSGAGTPMYVDSVPLVSLAVSPPRLALTCDGIGHD